MAILVTMQVGPVDWGKFKSAIDWSADKPAPGRTYSRVYRGEHDSNRVMIVEEWDSHESMHRMQDEQGDEFNSLAGTEGMEWEVATWELAVSLG